MAGTADNTVVPEWLKNPPEHALPMLPCLWPKVTCDAFVLGPAFAMLSTPGPSCLSTKFSSLNLGPGQQDAGDDEGVSVAAAAGADIVSRCWQEG